MGERVMFEPLAYPLLTATGIALCAYLGSRVRTQAMGDAPASWNEIFLGGLLGMALGAKLGYTLAEGLWRAPGSPASIAFWVNAFGGKTVTGGLLGAYVGVEWAKQQIGYQRPTGDLFAVTVPFSLALGRVGCVLRGCCLGISMTPAWFTVADAHGEPRWPAAELELAFNALFFLGALALSRRMRASCPHHWLKGQLFHGYLISYGLLRFVHEFVRDTPRIAAGFSGYQVLALGLATLGAVRFVQRERARGSSLAPDPRVVELPQSTT